MLLVFSYELGARGLNQRGWVEKNEKIYMDKSCGAGNTSLTRTRPSGEALAFIKRSTESESKIRDQREAC